MNSFSHLIGNPVYEKLYIDSEEVFAILKGQAEAVFMFQPDFCWDFNEKEETATLLYYGVDGDGEEITLYECEGLKWLAELDIISVSRMIDKAINAERRLNGSTTLDLHVSIRFEDGKAEIFLFDYIMRMDKDGYKVYDNGDTLRFHFTSFDGLQQFAEAQARAYIPKQA